MKHSSATLVSALALAMVTACGGGGEITSLEAVAAASPPPTAERVVTITGRERTATKASPAVDTSPASADSAPHIDPMVAHRVRAELDNIERALRYVDDGQVEKREALEVINDARAELKKDRPNKLKLRSLLSGLAQGVRTLDAAASDFLGRLVSLV